MTTTDFDTKHPRAAHSGRFVPTDHARRDAGQVDAFSEPRRSFVSRPAPRFDVLREVDTDLASGLMERREASLHARNDRAGRISLAEPGEPYRAYAVTRDGIDSNVEIHVVTRNAQVWIYSLRTGRLITMLFARPQQILRRVPHHERVDEGVMEHARANVSLQRNLR